MVREVRFGAAPVNSKLQQSNPLGLYKVQSSAKSAKSADTLWNFVRNFSEPWHPAVQEMAEERNSSQGLLRRFRVNGEDTIYREQLTFYSDSQRAYAYTNIDGIEGATCYDAWLKVEETIGGSSVTMSAELEAQDTRAKEIAAGTQAIFDIGVASIAHLAAPRSTPMQPKSDAPFVEIESIAIDSAPKLAVSVVGQRSGTACLFLHGIGGNRTNWEPQLLAIAPHCRVAAMDLRGYGDSELGSAQSDVDDYCNDILRVMEVLDADRLILCGLSYGAWIATSFAMRYPEKLQALVLSGGCTGMSQASVEERKAFHQSRVVPMSQGQTPADFASSVVDIISGPSASDKDRAALRLSMEAIPSETYADALYCFTHPTEQFDFAKLTMPVLLMTGAFDKLAPPDEISGVAQQIWNLAPNPDVRYEVIQDAGHVCNLEGYEQYNAYLSEFLTRVLA